MSDDTCPDCGAPLADHATIITDGTHRHLCPRKPETYHDLYAR